MVQGLGFVGDDPGALPGQRSTGQCLVHGGEGTDPPGLGDERPRGAGADGQDSGDLLDNRDLAEGPFLQPGVRRSHRILKLDGFGRVPGFQCGDLGFKPRHHTQPFQAEFVSTLQDVWPCAVDDISQLRVITEQRVEGRDRGMNARHLRCRQHAVSHTRIIAGGCDILRWRWRRF
ncbi:hypothetical protein [Arthrobacter sp. SD76]|uniref:hypothetical protein n=1 Tax=Arthrobacter sp. SD76 TaxID=3415007 RepID=UPI003C7755B9